MITSSLQPPFKENQDHISKDTVNSHLNDCQFPFLLLPVADHLQKACKYSLEFLPGCNMAVIVPYIVKCGRQAEERNKIPLLINLLIRG